MHTSTQYTHLTHSHALTHCVSFTMKAITKVAITICFNGSSIFNLVL